MKTKKKCRHYFDLVDIGSTAKVKCVNCNKQKTIDIHSNLCKKITKRIINTNLIKKINWGNTQESRKD